jgi:hypothetical protein
MDETIKEAAAPISETAQLKRFFSPNNAIKIEETSIGMITKYNILTLIPPKF